MIDLFADSNNPFYKFGDMLFLQKISRDEWVKFIIIMIIHLHIILFHNIIAS